MDDLQAVRRVLQGDREAFTHLVDAYYASSLRYAVRMLGTREDAEDAVQESFLRAYKSLGGYDHRDRFGAWLFRILVNRCRTLAGRRHRRDDGRVDLDRAPAHALEVAPPGSDPLGEARLVRVLEELDPRSREAFLLKYLQDMSYPEMARCTGDGVSALKMRVKRAREVLSERLKETPVV